MATSTIVKRTSYTIEVCNNCGYVYIRQPNLIKLNKRSAKQYIKDIQNLLNICEDTNG